MTYYIDEHGYRHDVLPKIWNNSTPINWEYLQSIGWQRFEIPDPPPEPEVKIYSRYKIKRKLVGMGLWERVKEAIEVMGCWDSFILIQDIRSDNDELLAALPVLAEAFPDVDIPALLSDCEV